MAVLTKGTTVLNCCFHHLFEISGPGEFRLDIPKQTLMIPGPTNIDPRVLEVMSKRTISHVSQAFATIFKECQDYTRELMMTKNEMFIVAGSGTLAMEVGVVNLIEPGDRVLCVCNGHFGERFVDIVSRHGAIPERIEVPWGKAVDPTMVRERLEKTAFKALTVVHVDTSTASFNPIKEIGEVAKDFDTHYVVDTVCSLGGMEVRVDDWNVDICLSASQKALAAPPGLAIVSASPKAMETHEKRKTPVSSYYGDFKNWIAKMRDATKYFATLPVHTIYAYHEAMRIILEEGLDARFRRHATMADAFRTAMRNLGLKLIADDSCAANTLTAVYYPEGITDDEFRGAIYKKHGIVIAGGLGSTKGKAFRVGHMGNINRAEINATAGAIRDALAEMGYKAAEAGKPVSVYSGR